MILGVLLAFSENGAWICSILKMGSNFIYNQIPPITTCSIFNSIYLGGDERI
jgi:hypothetical protein